MKLEIRSYHHTPKVCFYTIHKDDNELSETALFFNRFKDKPVYLEYLQTLRRLIANMGRFGAQRARFRPEDNAYALPFRGIRSRLRLYCVVCSSETIILCGGGEKTSELVKDSPDAYPHFLLAKKIDKLFTQRVTDGDITYSGKFLNGDLYFDEDFYLE